MSSSIIKFESFDLGKLTVTPLKSLESGAKQGYLNYNGGKVITQVGSLSLPYGMNVFDKAGPVKYSMELSLRGYDTDPYVKKVYDTFSALDEFMIDQGVKNSRAWFKAELTRDVVKAFYTPMVKFSKDAEGNLKPYPPTFKVNLRKVNDKFDVAVYDTNKCPYDVPLDDLLVKGSKTTTVMQCTSVWFAGSKYGLSWKALQIRMDSVPENMRGYAFLDDTGTKTQAQEKKQSKFTLPDDDEEESNEVEDDAVFSAQPAALTKPSVVAALMEDDDAEDSEPVPVPSKKVVTKKTVTKTIPKK